MPKYEQGLVSTAMRTEGLQDLGLRVHGLGLWDDLGFRVKRSCSGFEAGAQKAVAMGPADHTREQVLRNMNL